MRKRGRLTIALAAALVVALAAVACGDDSDSSTTAPAGGGERPAERAAAGGPPGGGSAGEGEPDSGAASPQEETSGAGEPAVASEDSPVGAERFVTPGGDNSVQEFGAEADESEFEAAAAALHAFLDARAEGDWETTCAYLSANVRDAVERFAAEAGRLRGKGCPELLAGVSGPATEDAREEAAIADVGAMRVEGDRAYLLYRGAAKTDYAIPMAREGDEWRVDAMGGVPLS